MQGLKIKIQNTDGRWLINDKEYTQCTVLERRYFDNFIKHNKQLLNVRSYG